jgi:membrane protease subunit HflK
MPLEIRTGTDDLNDEVRSSSFLGGEWLPELQRFFRRDWRKFRRPTPSGRSFAPALAMVLMWWLATGLYVVNPDEEGVVLRFGAISARAAPGIHYHWPWPAESVTIAPVTRENLLSIGYQRVDSQRERDVPEESLSLTGDENIVDIDFTVYWKIKDAGAFLFNVKNPGDQTDSTIKQVAESAMREVIGKNNIEPLLTVSRAAIQDELRILMQAILDVYGAGVTITRVQLQKIDPPAQVLSSYRDVQAARTDQDRMRNQAEAYANKVIPEARGSAARIIQQAEGYQQQVTAEAEGEAKRFLAIDEQYKKAPEVTRKRIYIDTMQSIFAGVDKVIIGTTGSAVTPYLPLQQLRQGPPAVPASPSPATPTPPVADAGGDRK